MNKSVLTTVVTSAVLVGAISILALPYWTDAQASSKKGEYESREYRQSSSYEREEDEDEEHQYRSSKKEDHEDEEYEYEHDDQYRNQAQRLNNETWRSECGECHVAYPPMMLPASSWRAVMEDLSHHFGVDASLDPQTRAEITDFLIKHAGREPSRTTEPLLRITETRWFKDEHQEELPASIWQHPQVKSAANCEACHVQAAQGDYDEDNIRLPR